MSKCGSVNLNIRCEGFSESGRTIRVPSDVTVLELVRLYCAGHDLGVVSRVMVNGVDIPLSTCPELIVGHEDNVSIVLIPQGSPQGGLSKETMRLLSSVGFELAGLAVPSLLGLSGMRQYMVRAGITLLGILAVNTLIPSLESSEESNVDFSGTRNAFRPGNRVPMVYGKVMYAPPMCAKPYTEIRAGKLYLKTIYSLGYRPLKAHMDTLRIGDNRINYYPACTLHLIDGNTRVVPNRQPLFKIYNDAKSIDEQVVSDELKFPGSLAIEWGRMVRGEFQHHEEVLIYTTQDNVTEFSIDLTFPNGLHGDGVTAPAEIRIEAQYQPDIGITESTQATWTNIVSDEFANYMTNGPEEITTYNVLGWLEGMDAVFQTQVDVLGTYLPQFTAMPDSITSATEDICEQMMELLDNLLAEAGLTSPQIVVVNTFKERVRLFREYNRRSRSLYRSTGLSNVNAFHSIDFSNAVQMFYPLIPMLQLQFMRYSGATDSEIELSTEYRTFTERRQSYTQVFGFINSGEIIISNATNQPLKYTLNTRVPTGRYRVRVRKATENSSISDGQQVKYDGYEDTVYVTAFRSIVETRPINPGIIGDLSFLEMEIPITDTVNGSLNEVSLVLETPLRYSEDGITWNDRATNDLAGNSVSRNPAWVYVDMLTGNGCISPVSLDKIDLPRIYEWAVYCRDNGYFFDKVIDNNDSLDKALDMACMAGKAMKIMRDELYSVAVDMPKENLSMFITPYNSRDFNASKSMGPIPDALAIEFINPAKDWSLDFIHVYNDGYGRAGDVSEVLRRCTANQTTAKILLPYQILNLVSIYDNVNENFVDLTTVTFTRTRDNTTLEKTSGFGLQKARYTVIAAVSAKAPVTIETITFEAMTDVPEDPTHEYHSGQVERMGRYLLRAMVHRPEVFTVEMDYEHLVGEVGDKVTLQHDVVLWGIGSGRVVSVTKVLANITEIYVDQNIDLVNGSYGIKVRKSDGSLWGPFSANYSTSNPTMFSLVAIDGTPVLGWGDLIVWGEQKLVSIDCIIREVHPRRFLEAKVTLVEESPQVHDSDSELIGQYNPNLTFPRRPALLKPPRPEVKSVITDERAMVRDNDGGLRVGIVLEYGFASNTSGDNTFNMSEIDTIDAQYRVTPTYLPNRPMMSTPWIGAGKFSVSTGVVHILGVSQGGMYDVRLRSLTSTGVLSDWTIESFIRVTGAIAPPPDVSAQTIFARGNIVSWQYTPPIDFAGFKVRYSMGRVTSWDELHPAHDGLIAETNITLKNVTGGIFSIGIKAVDVSGNESTNAAIVLLSTFDQQVGHPVLLIIGGPNNPTGVLTKWSAFDINDMTEEIGSTGDTMFLYGDTKTADKNTSIMWPILGLPAFGSSDLTNFAFSRRHAECNAQLSLAFVDHVPGEDLPYYMSIFATVDDSRVTFWQIQRKNNNAVLWSESDDDLLWLDSVDGDFWGSDSVWSPVTGPTKIHVYDDWEFRVWFPERSGGMDDTVVLQEVYAFEHFDIKTDTARAITDAPGEYAFEFGTDFFTQFNKITSVDIAIVENATYPNVRFARLVSGMAPSGFTVRTYDSSNSSVRGEVIVTVRGY